MGGDHEHAGIDAGRVHTDTVRAHPGPGHLGLTGWSSSTFSGTFFPRRSLARRSRAVPAPDLSHDPGRQGFVDPTPRGSIA